MPFVSTGAEAARSKTTHAFLMKRGYIMFGRAERLTNGKHKTDQCSPPKDTADGSEHILSAPGHHKSGRLIFRWVAAESAWERYGGIRMAFTDRYLSSHGWTYVGPAI